MKKSFIDDDRAIVANDQSAEVAQPSHGASDLPAGPITVQRPAVLSAGFATVPAMRCDQFDPSRRQGEEGKIAVSK